MFECTHCFQTDGGDVCGAMIVEAIKNAPPVFK